MTDTIEQRGSVMEQEVAELIKELIPTIADDYRATDDPDDSEPGMEITIASNDGTEWDYQTGDNSYTGACYFYRHWGVTALYRDSDPVEVARELVGQVMDGVVEEAYWQTA